MTSDSTGRKQRILDAKTLRAVAHPLRIRLLDLLEEDGPATATGLGKRVGESSGTTSWHLRQLADAGLVVEDTERGSKRERWWKPAQDSTKLRAADFLDDPELAGPVTTYLHQVVEQRYRDEAQFIAELPQWIDRWADKAMFDNVRLSLTPDEALAMSEEAHALIEKYRRDPRPGDDSVVTHWAAFPRTARPESEQ
ncbi:helix-turn-helix domain-containing protein [Amycolatopsis sp. NBC_01480]|uniref:helix-turn-helix domain-containing protein n=1 Tax=Amycolatopsis sp. NBC_01480 TaxID=2903562 RepID=UPI002E2C7C12|nr:helix-turn-helix domain-containing protein [Amycolatopsis sp. NBC_01480]